MGLEFINICTYHYSFIQININSYKFGFKRCIVGVNILILVQQSFFQCNGCNSITAAKLRQLADQALTRAEQLKHGTQDTSEKGIGAC